MPTAVRAWIRSHDDSLVFILLYLGLAVGLSLWVSLFWLFVVVAAHYALEVFCQAEHDAWWPGVALRALWEVKLDVAFVLFALVLAVYMDVIFGILGIGHAARAGVQGGARFAVWERVIRAGLLTADDALQVGRATVARFGGGSRGDDDVAPVGRWGGWGAPWGIGDRLSLGLGVLCAGLLLASPALTERDTLGVLAVFAEELHPWPPAEARPADPPSPTRAAPTDPPS